jgi:NitT/TauT family transport system substrate-binding protein
MRKINRRIAMAAVALGALAAAQGARAEEVVRIGLAVPQNAAYVQFYAAEALGFFKEAGVKPEITIYRGGAASQEAMSAGAADMITYFGAGAGLAIAKGAKEKIVSVIDPTPHGWHMLVMANSPIKSPKELDGKKIGVATKAGTADMFALWAADAAGVKVQTSPVGGGGMVPALRSAQVEAIAMFPGASLSLVVSGEARSILDLGKEMLPTLPDVIVASDEFMAKKPEAVRGTLRALYKALAYMRDNREWGLKFLKEFTQEKDDRTNELVFDQVVTQISKDGAIDLQALDNSMKIGAKVWGQPELAAIKPEAIATSAFLPGR